jgi:hypothetical protein
MPATNMNALRILAIAAVAFGFFEVRAEAVSADGSTLTVAQSQAGGSLVTSAGTWTFGASSNNYGNSISLNGAGVGGHATLLEVANGGQVYAQASDGSWWKWNNPGWSSSSAPPTTTTVSPDGSTLTVAQSQAGGSLVTASGVWTFGASSNVYGNSISLNGAGVGGHATLLEVANGGQIYAQASDGSWWKWNNPGWSSSSAPTAGIAITGATFNGASNRRQAQGSDNWPTTWSNNDKQYSIWGDGGGFGGGNDPVPGGRSPVGVAEISGDYNNYSGRNVYGGIFGTGACSATDPDGTPHTLNVKSHGAPLSLGGVLYAWFTPESDVAGYVSFSLYKSMDYGCSWNQVVLNQVPVTFDRSTYHVSFAGFVQFGKDNTAAIDSYVYIVATAVPGAAAPDSLKVVQVPGNVMLLRVPAASIEVKSAYQFYQGLVNGQPSWSTGPDPSRAAPTYSDGNGVGPFAQMSYVPALGRFVYTNQHGNGRDVSGFQSLLTMAEAPAPWGPWTNFYYDPFFPAPMLTVAQSQAGGTLVTTAGTWTFGASSNTYGNSILLNNAGVGGHATVLAVASGQVYAQASDGSWWRWNNPGWSSSAAPFEQNLFQWNFAPKWFRNGGRDFTLIFSGVNTGPDSNDSWNTIDGTFKTSP